MGDAPILGFEGAYRFLSNFYPSPFEVDGFKFKWVEQWYMLNKSDDQIFVTLIMSAPSPGECKRLGRRAILRPDWERIKDAVMLDGLRFKFEQNRDLRMMLLATGKRYIEETNTWGDTYWGVCNGVGKNMLGIQLMRVRAELMA